jgi:hypothetical protein
VIRFGVQQIAARTCSSHFELKWTLYQFGAFQVMVRSGMVRLHSLRPRSLKAARPKC